MKCSVKIGKLVLKNPVMAASGTFGYGEEFGSLAVLKKLGAIVSKTITLNPRPGNIPPRTCETYAGMLNSIGLENPGAEVFLKEKLPVLKRIGVPLIVSIASEGDAGEFAVLARRLDAIPAVEAIELNISCPNVVHKKGGTKYPLIAQDARATYAVVKTVRKATRKTVITKLSPNVTDITEIALAAEQAGSDAVSLVNTFYGMSIDIAGRRPKLGNRIGGVSGPAIKPLALKMVCDAAQKLGIPVIGMGGIMNAGDALEFLIAGATAVAVGTANFVTPGITGEIVDGIQRYLRAHKIGSINSLIGSIRS
ncbi:MAG: dihydroorotate dehydrogenase [Candidatus Omnitrophica bacterium]|nr:dihydroorotate dehydrogenase [Candidatus Omnitrophota bacterium]